MCTSAADRGVLWFFQAAVAICVALACASTSVAVPLYYEPFLLPNSDGDPITDPAEPALGEYNLGSLGDQNPTVGPTPFLSGPWEVQVDSPNAVVQEPGSSYLGAPAAGGSQLSTPNSRPRRFLSSPWTATTTGTFYLSFVVNFGQGFYDDGVDGNDMGYRAIELWRDDGSFAMNIAYNTYSSSIGPVQQNPLTGRMYFGGFGGDQILDGSPDSFSQDGVAHLIVARFNLSDQAASDSIFLYLDPTSTTEPDLPSASAGSIDFTLGALGGFSIFGGSGVFPVFDEMRVSTTFLEALPTLPLPGDANGDGEVDINDFNTITAHLNLTGQTAATGDVAGADGKQGSDGRVDLRDLSLWRRNRTDVLLGGGAGSGSLANGSVPEPTTAALLALGMASLATWCIGRRRN